MKLKSLQFLSVVLATIFLASCSNIQITKRTYRKGFHVDLVKKNDKRHQNDITEAKVESPKKQNAAKHDGFTGEPTPIAENKQSLKSKDKGEKDPVEIVKAEPVATASEVPSDGILDVKPYEISTSDFAKKNFEAQKDRVYGKLKKAFKPMEEEKSGWSIFGFVGFGLGVIAFIMAILTLFTLVTALVNATSLMFVWVYGIIGLVLGIAGMIMGILGINDTKNNGKKGKGFALAGMISGIVGMAFGLIFFIWGYILDIILNE